MASIKMIDGIEITHEFSTLLDANAEQTQAVFKCSKDRYKTLIY